MGKEKGGVVRGCISSRRGPWLVHRTRKDGSVVTRERNPSAAERLKNMQRECNRRAVTRKIFDGVRAHGNYKLPKNADTNELLKALCSEAGWHVEEDGTIYRKNQDLTNLQHEDKCDKDSVPRVENELMSTNICLGMLQEDQNIDVTLSLWPA